MATKKERIAHEVARAVGAGKPVAMETVDFSDPNRPKTCLEVDFPILPVNQVAAVIVGEFMVSSSGRSGHRRSPPVETKHGCCLPPDFTATR